MKSWKELIPGGFAGMDAPFAQHPNDERRAHGIIEVMRAADVTWEEAEAAIRDYLVSKGVAGGKLEKQMERVTEMVRPCLQIVMERPRTVH